MNLKNQVPTGLTSSMVQPFEFMPLIKISFKLKSVLLDKTFDKNVLSRRQKFTDSLIILFV